MRDMPASPQQASTLDTLTDEFITASRALLGLAVRSINAAPVEVTLPQHRLLVLLAADGAQPVGALADRLGVNASNASRLCDRLQRLDLISRRRSPTDGRSVEVALTRAGRALLDTVSAHRRAEVGRTLAGVSAAEGRAIVVALRAFNHAADEASDADWAVTQW